MQARLEICLVALLSGISAMAQVQAPADKEALREQIVQKVCRGPEIRSGPELEELHRVMQKLGAITNQDKQHRTFIALANDNEINAWATNFNMTDSMICVPVAMVHFMTSWAMLKVNWHSSLLTRLVTRLTTYARRNRVVLP